MKRRFLQILACPSCVSPLDLREVAHYGNTVSEGSLVCMGCGASFPVKEGILDFMVHPGAVVRKEVSGMVKMLKKERSRATDEWLLGLPETYSQLYEDKKESWSNELTEVRALIMALDLPAGSLILDLGAGTTWTTNLLASIGHDAVAVDIASEKFIGLSSGLTFMEHHGTYYERVLADMGRRLPFKDHSFDAVLCFGSIHHSPDIRTTFHDLARILKRRAKLGILDGSLGLFEPRSRFGKAEKEAYGLNEHKYRLSEYRSFASAAGFSFKILPAPSFFAKMQGLCQGSVTFPPNVGMKHWLGLAVARTLWKLSHVRAFAGRLYPVLSHLIGTQILAVCAKAL